MLKPLNNRIIGVKIEEEQGELGEVPGTNAQLDKYCKIKVNRSSVEAYKRGDILVVPSYVDTIMDKKKELVIVHESDVVAIEA